MEHFAAWVAGQWSQEGERLNVDNPFDGTEVGSTVWADAAVVEQALTGAVRAAGPMAELSSDDRAQALSLLHSKLAEHRDELVRLMAFEAGKPVKLAGAEFDRALLTVLTAAEEAKRLGGDLLPLDVTAATRGHFGILRRFPIGPVLGISPFNFPLNLGMHKVAAAIASGNPIVLKPTPKAPLTWLYVARLLAETPLPPGGVSVLVCSNELATSMVEDERVKMVSFTGSAPVGWALKARAPKKRVILELGGNAGAIVDETADPARAATTLAGSAFGYAGQSCISAQRIFVAPELLEDFTSHLVSATESLKVGDPLDPETDVGPLIDADATQRVASWVDEAVASGARVLTGAKTESALYHPTVLTDAPASAKVCSEEVFGPVVHLAGYESFARALDEVNASEYGLQAALFSNDLSHMWTAYHRLVVGGIVVNGPPSYRVDPMPYGGVKQSGFGREGIKYAMEEMTEPRLLVIAGMQGGG